MSMVDVLIMTYGSFGLFAALLTKDKHEVHPGSGKIGKMGKI